MGQETAQRNTSHNENISAAESAVCGDAGGAEIRR